MRMKIYDDNGKLVHDVKDANVGVIVLGKYNKSNDKIEHQHIAMQGSYEHLCRLNNFIARLIHDRWVEIMEEKKNE